MYLLSTAQNGLYPFDRWRELWCRPYVCVGGVLTRCDIGTSTLGVQILDLKDRRITGIESSAFRDYSTLQMLSLAGNRISQLSPSVFDGAEHLVGLDLSRNSISSCEGVFTRSLLALGLRNNRIALLRSGALSGDGIRNLLLDDNGMREAEPGAFDAMPRLELVWLGGNVLNCSSVRLSFPSGVRCLEQRCDVAGPEYIGNGYCYGQLEQNYDTAQSLRVGQR